MATTLKEKIGDLLRHLGSPEDADQWLREGRYGSVSVSYGDNVQVFVSEKFGGEMTTVGVNWSAMGTRSAATAYEMARNLTDAAKLAQAVQDLIDEAG